MAIRGRYRLFSSIVRIASSENLSFNSRLKSIAIKINNSLGAIATTLYILDEGRRCLSQMIRHDDPEEIHTCSIPLGEGDAGSCASFKSAILKWENGLREEQPGKASQRTLLCLPVPSGKKINGVISLEMGKNIRFSADDNEFLQDIALILGSLIQNRRIIEWSNKRVQNLMTLNELGKIINKPVSFKVLPSFILGVCHRYTNACCTVLRIIAYESFPSGVLKKCRRKFQAVLPSLLELEARYAEKSLSTGAPLLTTDIIADEILPPSCVCVPLYYEATVIGTLTFFGKQMDDGTFGSFDEEDRELFESIATSAASALGIAARSRQMNLLAGENSRKIKELSLLYRISTAMHSTTRLNELIYLALNALVSDEDPIFERAMLFLVNERAGVIQGMLGVDSETSRAEKMAVDDGRNILSPGCETSGGYAAGEGESELARKVKESRMPLDKKSNMSSRAILEKKLIHVSDAAREKRIDREFLERFAINEFAAVPLMAKNEVVGLVIVDNPLTRKSITKSDLRFLQLLLNQAGIAIENSMLYSRIEDAHRDYREVQQKLIQGEKLAAIGEMAASIAHELRGPLVSIGGLAKRLERKFPHDSYEWKYADIIARESDRLEKMLTDTLFFSKKAELSFASCDINAILEESLAVVASQLELNRISVKLRTHPEIGPFCGDFLQLKQVFINLFSNAAESMKNGGALFIVVSPARLEGMDALYVKVSDTGGGIPLEVMGNIFNPFFTTKEHGTGLGLPISHRIVTNHGGKILVYNRLGSGAQFKVILPLQPKIPHAR